MVLKGLRYGAAGLVLIAMAVFVILPFVGEFRLTEQVFEEVVDASHQDALKPLLHDDLDRSFSGVHGLVQTVNETVATWNDAARVESRWDEVIYTDYAFTIAHAAAAGWVVDTRWLLFFLVFGLPVVGGLLFIWLSYRDREGVAHHGVFHRALTSRGGIALILGVVLIAFYVVLYWFPAYAVNWVLLVDPVSEAISGSQATQWFLYGFMYTLVILVMGVRMLLKYQFSPYHSLRTASLMFFQLCFAFIIPEVLSALNLPAQDLKNIWPLDYSFFFDYRLDALTSAGTFGFFLLGWGLLLFLVVVPVMTYFYGKRWYCSWVCGCGGLAETAGDPFRQLSDKRLVAWQIERWMIHGVLVFAVLMTVAVLYTYLTGEATLVQLAGWSLSSFDLRSWYGFAIGAAFAGVVGTGFYPFMGNRVWCRFGCPLAAYLGLIQRFKSRFRITTNGGQCISCGNCSTYCEMGIDVRAYAQRGQNIVRSSCVGCGICATVCPRGVLKLENGSDDGASRTEVKPIVFGNDGVRINI
jgi:polyferredoxin